MYSSSSKQYKLAVLNAHRVQVRLNISWWYLVLQREFGYWYCGSGSCDRIYVLVRDLNSATIRVVSNR